MDTYLERNHLIYALSKRSDIQVGHVYARSFFPRGITVNAISSQISASLPFGRNALYGRLRFENRFFEYTRGASNRLRTQTRLTRRLIGDRVYAFVMDELFFNLNSIERGPSQGFDQNRFMSGVGFRIYKQLRFDVAYLQQYINRRSGLPDLVNNILFMQTSQAF